MTMREDFPSCGVFNGESDLVSKCGGSSMRGFAN
jgi:hypothetical protein